MGFFSKFEGKMEDTFEGAAGKMQKSPISPVQIMKKAEKQMRREKVVGAGKQFAPTLYTVLVNPDDDQRLFGFYPTLAGECETRLASSANAEGLSMDGHPLVRFIVDDGLKHGKFDIIAEVVSAPIVAQLRAEEMQRYGMGTGAAAQGAIPQPREASYGAYDAPSAGGAYDESYGAPALDASSMGRGGAFPDIDARPYEPERAIDYSVDRGEYGLDGRPEGAGRPAHARHQARDDAFGLGADDAYAARGLQASNLPNPAYPQVGQVFAGPGQNLAEHAAGVAGAGAAAEPARAAAPAYGAAPRTMVFAAGAAQADPVANASAVRARLIDAKSNRSYDLATNRVLIGRESANDIVLNDLNVSRHHAEVVFEPQGVWVITDLGSTNGTFVNGMPVSRRGLSEGDRIAMGMTEFVFSLR